MKLKVLVGLGLFGFVGALQAYEAPTGWANVSKVTVADVVRFEINGATLCNTNIFSIDLTKLGAKEQFSLVLAAAASGKKIWVETWLPCTSYTDPSKNWGMFGTVVTTQF